MKQHSERVSSAAAMALRWIILFFGLGLAAAKLTGDTENDVDEGHDWDILSINEAAGLDLLEGDIVQEEHCPKCFTSAVDTTKNGVEAATLSRGQYA